MIKHRARNIDSHHKFYILTQGSHNNIFKNNICNKKMQKWTVHAQPDHDVYI